SPGEVNSGGCRRGRFPERAASTAFAPNLHNTLMAEQPQISFICCVESGPLEDQTVRMVESLRRWGGRLAEAPVVAVTPRFGPPLARTTRRALDRLSARHVRA